MSRTASNSGADAAAGEGSESGPPAGVPSLAASEPPSAPARFEPAELQAVLARYDLGRIDSIREFARGSPASPKAIVAGPLGRFLVKRRAPGEDHPHLVAFCHGLHLHLLDRGFPAPALVGTRDDNNSMLQLDGRVYEVSEFIEGAAFARTPEQARAAGAMLARFHAGVRGFHARWHTPADFAHADERIEFLIDRCVDRLGDEGDRLLDEVRGVWRRAVAALDELGVAAWDRDLLHGDWHPGNVVFEGDRISAVIDYDSARRGPRVVDVAAGVLNFSIRAGGQATEVSPVAGESGVAGDSVGALGAPLPGGGDPARWPAEPDEARASAFLGGYAAGCVERDRAALSEAERRALAPAMAAALLRESLPPIAATGGFAGMAGLGVLEMVRRKAAWLLENQGRVAAMAGG
ncbi:MAG: phosphotransferase [Phycisphaerales bacterium]